jgi:hypothetical protein
VLSVNRKMLTVTARSKLSSIFAHSNAGIVGSNPTRGMKVCPHFFVYVILRPKLWNVFARSNTKTVGSNLSRDMNLCKHFFCLCYTV